MSYRFPELLQRLVSRTSGFSYAVLLLLSGNAGIAQEPESIDYQIPNTTGSPQIDGVFSDGEWDDALLVELTNETNPGQNVPAPVKTEVYVMEDGENFLVAFVAEDPEPDKIRAFYRDRDRAFQDDLVGFVIDTFNDERRAFEFFSNPLGVQMDLINDDVGAEYFNTNADLVYTRNISDPDYGIKLTGKSGDHTYAVMAADDQRTGFVIPGNLGSRIATIADTSSQDLAARYRYDYGRTLRC